MGTWRTAAWVDDLGQAHSLTIDDRDFSGTAVAIPNLSGEVVTTKWTPERQDEAFGVFACTARVRCIDNALVPVFSAIVGQDDERFTATYSIAGTPYWTLKIQARGTEFTRGAEGQGGVLVLQDGTGELDQPWLTLGVPPAGRATLGDLYAELLGYAGLGIGLRCAFEGRPFGGAEPFTSLKVNRRYLWRTLQGSPDAEAPTVRQALDALNETFLLRVGQADNRWFVHHRGLLYNAAATTISVLLFDQLGQSEGDESWALGPEWLDTAFKVQDADGYKIGAHQGYQAAQTTYAHGLSAKALLENADLKRWSNGLPENVTLGGITVQRFDRPDGLTALVINEIADATGAAGTPEQKSVNAATGFALFSSEEDIEGGQGERLLIDIEVRYRSSGGGIANSVYYVPVALKHGTRWYASDGSSSLTEIKEVAAGPLSVSHRVRYNLNGGLDTQTAPVQLFVYQGSDPYASPTPLSGLEVVIQTYYAPAGGTDSEGVRFVSVSPEPGGSRLRRTAIFGDGPSPIAPGRITNASGALTQAWTIDGSGAGVNLHDWINDRVLSQFRKRSTILNVPLRPLSPVRVGFGRTILAGGWRYDLCSAQVSSLSGVSAGRFARIRRDDPTAPEVPVEYGDTSLPTGEIPAPTLAEQFEFKRYGTRVVDNRGVLDFEPLLWSQVREVTIRGKAGGNFTGAEAERFGTDTAPDPDTLGTESFYRRTVPARTTGTLTLPEEDIGMLLLAKRDTFLQARVWLIDGSFVDLPPLPADRDNTPRIAVASLRVGSPVASASGPVADCEVRAIADDDTAQIEYGFSGSETVPPTETATVNGQVLEATVQAVPDGHFLWVRGLGSAGAPGPYYQPRLRVRLDLALPAIDAVLRLDDDAVTGEIRVDDPSGLVESFGFFATGRKFSGAAFGGRLDGTETFEFLDPAIYVGASSRQPLSTLAHVDENGQAEVLFEARLKFGPPIRSRHPFGAVGIQVGAAKSQQIGLLRLSIQDDVTEITLKKGSTVELGAGTRIEIVPQQGGAAIPCFVGLPGAAKGTRRIPVRSDDPSGIPAAVQFSDGAPLYVDEPVPVTIDARPGSVVRLVQGELANRPAETEAYRLAKKNEAILSTLLAASRTDFDQSDTVNIGGTGFTVGGTTIKAGRNVFTAVTEHTVGIEANVLSIGVNASGLAVLNTTVDTVEGRVTTAELGISSNQQEILARLRTTLFNDVVSGGVVAKWRSTQNSAGNVRVSDLFTNVYEGDEFEAVDKATGATKRFRCTAFRNAQAGNGVAIVAEDIDGSALTYPSPNFADFSPIYRIVRAGTGIVAEMNLAITNGYSVAKIAADFIRLDGIVQVDDSISSSNFSSAAQTGWSLTGESGQLYIPLFFGPDGVIHPDRGIEFSNLTTGLVAGGTVDSPAEITFVDGSTKRLGLSAYSSNIDSMVGTDGVIRLLFASMQGTGLSVPQNVKMEDVQVDTLRSQGAIRANAAATNSFQAIGRQFGLWDDTDGLRTGAFAFSNGNHYFRLWGATGTTSVSDANSVVLSYTPSTGLLQATNQFGSVTIATLPTS